MYGYACVYVCAYTLYVCVCMHACVCVHAYACAYAHCTYMEGGDMNIVLEGNFAIVSVSKLSTEVMFMSLCC